MIPEPLLKAIQTKRCLLFIGAGFSKNAVLPDGLTMPNWKGLAKELSKELEVKTDDPLKAASDYASKFDKNELIRKLSEILHVDNAEPGKVHEKLTTIIAFDTIVTTNFEFLLEKAYSGKKPSQVIVGDEHIGKYSPSTHTNIIKIHGDFTHYKDFVVTQKDYNKFLKVHPVLSTNLAAWFSTKIPLFIGYSLSDPHFQQLRHILKKQLGEFMNKGYIVLFDANKKTVKEYEDDNLFVINLKTNGKTREEVLLEFLCQIQDYVSVKDADYPLILNEEEIEKLTTKIAIDEVKHIQSGKIINIFSEFEDELRNVLREYGIREDHLKRSFSYLIKTAAQNGILAPFEVGELSRIRDIRNSIAHTKYIPTLDEVDYVLDIVKIIQKRFSEIKFPTEQAIIQLSTNSTIVTDESTLTINGHVSPKILDTPISLRITNPKNQNVMIAQLVVDQVGNFKTEIRPGGPLWDHSGIYRIIAQYGGIKNHKSVEIRFLKKLLPLYFPYSIKMAKKNYRLSYFIKGGNLKNIIPDLDSSSLILNIMPNSEGEISIKLPRTLIDAKDGSVDDHFYVMSDGEQISFEEKKSEKERELSIQFSEDTHRIDVIGTRIGEQLTKLSNTVKILEGSGAPRKDEKYLNPQTLIIEKGQTVTWENVDHSSHTITSGTPEQGADGEFDSSLFMPGDTFSKTFDKNGTYRYFCLVHPWKEGKIIVK